MKQNYSRGAKHGRTQEQYDHFKANESTRNALKKEYLSMTDRCHRDELHRHFQIAVAWTEEYCQCLDSFMSIDSTCTASRKECGRYGNNLTLGVNGQRPKSGPMKNKADVQQAVHQLIFLKQQVEKAESVHSHTFLRFWQRPN